ncbi:DeoR family transcriptional regulator [Paenibacillus sp. J31TS4]|uniref:DeoR/GlpR family DNA-binding transcription regulator n=1 Tax=Paenibacillus sp. J31TS4 TaxID=2807195 RepID=UPI001B0FA218|nr:DeoR/GlpR family DNA-binding transcription regulator [Paenibacillus sp. J31TS4]GIP39721.1 DeoR family transcriptional regulator [Paenibacillus sp. J31TS4]
MLAAERKRKIIEYVRLHRSASVAALAGEFGVHEVTIRRDLAEIEQEGLLKRTHGGVIVEQLTRQEASFRERSHVELDQKRRIGQAAAELVEDGDHILIDSGTTTLHLAEQLVNRTHLTVVTNDIQIAAELRDAPGVKVLVTGGELYPSSNILNGMFTDAVLRSVHVSKAFLGIPALHPKRGLMHPDAQLVPAKQGMIAAAQEVIVLADDTKIGKLSLHQVAPMSAVHTLITGSGASGYDLQTIQEAGVHVLTV